MRIFFVVLVAACLAVPAFALIPSPYIGANLQVNSPTGKFKDTDIVNKEGGAKTGVGGEIDFGIGSGTGDLYLGYRFGKNNVKAKFVPSGGGPTVSTEGSWDLNRFVLGARWHLLGSLPITPTIGAGLTMGKTKLSADAATKDAESSNKTGWFLEAGGLVRIPTVPISALADIQYNRFDAKFDTPDINGTFDISYFTFQIGLTYSFIPL